MILRSARSLVALTVALATAMAMPAFAADPARAPAAATAPAPRGVEMRMSKLIGMSIHNPAGQRLGKIRDVIMDTSSGRLHYAVLSFGGFLGVGDKLFAIPLEKLKPGDKGRLLLDADREQLKAAPGFPSDRWPNWGMDPYSAEVDKRWAASAASSGARLRRASEVLKAEVRDANLADIGDIEDIVIDLSTGRVHYVVVEFDRAWTPKDKLVALPMSALSDLATAPPAKRDADATAPSRKPPGVLSLEAPQGPTKGTATAVDPPGGVKTTPAAAGSAAGVKPIERPALPTTTSYADDEDLLYRGTREQLRDAPAFDKKQYPDLRDPARRKEFDQRLERL